MLCKSIIRADNPKVKFCCIQRAYDTSTIPKPSVYELHPESIEDANDVVSEFDSEEEMKKSMEYLDGDFF